MATVKPDLLSNFREILSKVLEETGVTLKELVKFEDILRGKLVKYTYKLLRSFGQF